MSAMSTATTPETGSNRPIFPRQVPQTRHEAEGGLSCEFTTAKAPLNHLARAMSCSITSQCESFDNQSSNYRLKEIPWWTDFETPVTVEPDPLCERSTCED